MNKVPYYIAIKQENDTTYCYIIEGFKIIRSNCGGVGLFVSNHRRWISEWKSIGWEIRQIPEENIESEFILALL